VSGRRDHRAAGGLRICYSDVDWDGGGWNGWVYGSGW
jgi:hypothetical protein